MILKTIYLLTAFSVILVHTMIAQNQSDRPEVYFQDFHAVEVTHTTASPDGSFFWTGDRSGKVLQWDATDMTVIKTLTEGNGIPVRSMRLSPDGQSVMVSTGMDISGTQHHRLPLFNPEAAPDTTAKVTYYPVFESPKAEPVEIMADANIHGGIYERDLLFSLYHPSGNLLTGYTKDNEYNRTFAHPLGHNVVVSAVYFSDKGMIALGVIRPDMNYYLEFRDAETFTLLNEMAFGRNPVIDMQFIPQKSRLLFLILNRETEKAEIYLMDPESSVSPASPDHIVPVRTSLPQTVFTEISNADKLRILVTCHFYRSRLITIEDSGFSETLIQHDDYYSNYLSGTFIPALQRAVVFSRDYTAGGITTEVFDKRQGKMNERLSRQPISPVEATFLPSGGHLVSRYQYPGFLKYYPSGSLINRFGRHDFYSYMFLFHGIGDAVPQAGLHRSAPIIDDLYGKAVFYNMNYREGKRDVYVYDFSDDTADLLIRLSDTRFVPRQYRHHSNSVLFSHVVDESSFKLYRDGDFFDISGSYAHITLSISGGYLLTVNEERNVLQISKTGEELETVFEYNSDFQMQNITSKPSDESGFMFSYSGFTAEGFKQRTLILEHRNGAYTYNSLDDVYFKDFAFSENFEQFIMLGAASFIGLKDGRFHRLDAAVEATNISLNQSGDRFMVSFPDGTVRIYETESLEEIARMLHPNRREQILINRDGYYSSNSDPSRWLAARNASGTLPLEAASFLERPDKVLQSISSPSPGTLRLLEQSTRLHKSRISAGLSPASGGSIPQISNFRINGETIPVDTNQETIDLSFEVTDSDASISSIEIFRNGVLVSHPYENSNLDSGETHHIQVSTQVTDGENIIQVRAVNAAGGVSYRSERRINARLADAEPELFVLSIGVSDYQDSEFDLTWADKDAWDLSILFGSETSVSLDDYNAAFYATSYSPVNTAAGRKTAPVLYTPGDYESFGMLFPIGKNGARWIESRGVHADSPFFLWDFESGTRAEIDLPDYDFSNDYNPGGSFIFDVSGDHILYINDRGGISGYTLENGTKFEWDAQGLRFSNIQPWGENRFAAQLTYGYRVEQQSPNAVYAIEHEAGNISIERLEIELEESDTIRAAGFYGDRPVLLANNYSNGFRVLYTDEPGLERRLRTVSERGYNQTFRFSDDGDSVITIYQDRSAEWPEQKHIVYSYPLQGTETDSTVTTGTRNLQLGVNIEAGRTMYISAGPPLIQPDFMQRRELEKMISTTPGSFRNVHIRKLVNREATRENILRELNEFLSQARLNDQVLVFLAGHGVLGDDYGYYFAAHDMDFNNPEGTGISYEEIISAIAASPASRRLLLMDTCHAGEVFELELAEGVESRFENESSRTVLRRQQERFTDNSADIISLLFNRFVSSRGVTVVSASGGAEFAYEFEDLTNGAFTTAVLEYIGTDRQYSLLLTDDFMEYVGTKVMEYSRNRQVPNIRERNPLSEVLLW